ncbi:hypothetical protein [Actinophytocola sp.]|uniref:hypothetical protein n=1 Tax=Actinophytocola sp. TaxID=1872138 RepID=UPI003899A628
MQPVETITQLALGWESVLLDVEPGPTPGASQRPNGESVFTRHGAQRYTSEEILAAEQRLVDASQTDAGPVVSRFVRNLAIRRFETCGRKKVQLNPGQRALVEASSPPAGSSPWALARLSGSRRSPSGWTCRAGVRGVAGPVGDLLGQRAQPRFGARVRERGLLRELVLDGPGRGVPVGRTQLHTRSW